MISDVLHDAIEEIERYQRDFRCYDDETVRREINTVKAAMVYLRTRLDNADDDWGDDQPAMTIGWSWLGLVPKQIVTVSEVESDSASEVQAVRQGA